MNVAEKFILGELFSDFKQRKLKSDDLESQYEGPKIDVLKSRATNEGIDEVDFEVGFKALEKNEHIKTGPWDMYPGSATAHTIIMPFPYSKREHACLTHKGYREASKNKSTPIRAPHTIIQGDQYNVA